MNTTTKINQENNKNINSNKRVNVQQYLRTSPTTAPGLPHVKRFNLDLQTIIFYSVDLFGLINIKK